MTDGKPLKQIKWLPKQRYIGSWLGTLLFVQGESQQIRGLFLSILGTITLWGVWDERLLIHLPWMNYFIFIGFLVFLEIGLCTMGWIFVASSRIAVGNFQGYTHRNPLRRDHIAIMENQEILAKALNVELKHKTDSLFKEE